MKDYMKEFDAIFSKWREVYLDRPEDGLDIAGQAVKCAEGLGKALMARALALQGSAFKVVGRFSEAESTFRQALNLLHDEHKHEKADVLRRLAYLRVEQLKFNEALSVINEAAELSAELPDHNQATIMIAEGFVCGCMERHHDALTAFTKALEKIDHSADPGAGDIALHNMIVAISLAESFDHGILESVLQRLDTARSVRKGEIFRLKLKWAEALVDLKFGINNRALRTLTGLRREFRRKKRPSMDFVMASIDISQAHIQTGNMEKCLSSLQVALTELGALEGIDQSALAALAKCIDAVKKSEFEIGLLFLARRALLKPTTLGGQSLQTAQYPGE